MPRDGLPPALSRPRSPAIFALVALLHAGLVLLAMRERRAEAPPPASETVTVAIIVPPAPRPAAALPMVAEPPQFEPPLPSLPMPALIIAGTEPARHQAPPAPPAAAIEPSDRNPVALANNPAPAYPELARKKGFEGTVVLRVSVSTEGQPTAIALAASSGHDLLDDRAIETVWRWRFQPAFAQGRIVAGLVLVPVTFELHA